MTTGEPPWFTIRPMRAADADAVMAIYQAGMNGGLASFESRAPIWAAFDAGKPPDHRYVAVNEHDRVLGWVTVSAVSSRAVYAGVVEHSVYIHPDAQGRGVGLALLQTLIEASDATTAGGATSCSSNDAAPPSADP
jgi:L-amino acid N-acyltransferase YncA